MKRYLSLWWTKLGHGFQSDYCLLEFEWWRDVLFVQWGIYLFLTCLLICLLSLMWHVLSPVLLCCVALSSRWESFSVPLWDVFDFTTCGETFHLLIFPGVWGCNRLCKHKLIHHQLHNRLQSFLIPLKSLWTTMKMNFLPATRHGLLKKITHIPFHLICSFLN